MGHGGADRTEREHSSLGTLTPTEYAQMILDRTETALSLTADSSPERDQNGCQVVSTDVHGNPKSTEFVAISCTGVQIKF